MANISPFMNEVRETIRARHMALATEKTYCYWIRFFIRKQHYKTRSEIKAGDVTRFLSYLAVTRHVSSNTQNQAFNAILFMFRHVINQPLEDVDAVRSRKRRKIP